MEKILVLQNFNIFLNNEILAENLNLELNEGSIVGIFAPTGSGKTTLLNAISGFSLSDDFKISGKIELSEEIKISYAFQEPRLIEHLSAIKNVQIPLEKIYSKKEIQIKTREIMEAVNLEKKSNCEINKLSGGEKQRTALARAFVYPGKLLLLDEPFSAQDEKNKEKLILLTKKIIEEEKRCALIVSHNKNELQALCQKIIHFGNCRLPEN